MTVITSNAQTEVMKEFWKCEVETQDRKGLRATLADDFKSESSWFSNGKRARKLECDNPDAYVNFIAKNFFTNKETVVSSVTFSGNTCVTKSKQVDINVKASLIVEQTFEFSPEDKIVRLIENTQQVNEG